MQTVHATITLNYQLDPARAGEIYRIMRQDYKTRAIDPAIQEGVKAATAQFDAEQLIAKRESVRMAIKEILTAKLTTPFGIRIIDVSITDFNFSPEFNAAIEAKAKATQEAETARRNLEKVKMEQAAQVEIAKAQAESLRLQRQNVTPELVRLRALEVQKAWVEKWDGKMPVTMMGSNTPVIMNLPNQ
jgi:regulator of protease activity HflC (stomatin/prohibitin superfamily)